MYQDSEEPIRTNERLIIAKEAARVARARKLQADVKKPDQLSKKGRVQFPMILSSEEQRSFQSTFTI
jgi:hypothetical protein